MDNLVSRFEISSWYFFKRVCGRCNAGSNFPLVAMILKLQCFYLRTSVPRCGDLPPFGRLEGLGRFFLKLLVGAFWAKFLFTGGIFFLDPIYLATFFWQMGSFSFQSSGHTEFWTTNVFFSLTFYFYFKLLIAFECYFKNEQLLSNVALTRPNKFLTNCL